MPRLSVISGAGQARVAAQRSSPAALDERLVSLARPASEGDREALDEVLRQLGPAMLRVVRVVLGVRAADAEDVFQESLLGLVGALPYFRGECGLRHFACRIAARTAVRARRRLQVKEDHQHELCSREEALAPGAPEPSATVTAQRRQNLLRQLLNELPEEQAETLVLRVVLGCSLSEVAAATGVPLNTVRSRIRLAKEALRRRIADDLASAELFEVVP